MNYLRAIIFDLDGTLIDSTIDFQKMKKRIIQFLEQSGVQPGLLTTTLLNQEIETRAQTFLRKNGMSNDLISMIFREVTNIMNDIELESLATIQAYSDSQQTLRQVHNLGIKIGIITRGCREYAENALTRVQLRKFIDGIVARDDVTNPKPNPEHPYRLLKLLGVNASETILVGDTTTDLLCAHNIHMPCVWLNRRYTDLPLQTPQPDYEIHNLIQLVDILKSKLANSSIDLSPSLLSKELHSYD